MVLGQMFSKPLTDTDVEWRLAIPTKYLKFFGEIPEGRHSIDFTALDLKGDSWDLCLSIRKEGHPKPVLNGKGWRLFVEAKGLKEGDEIIFSRKIDEANRVIFEIKACRTLQLMGTKILVEL